MDAITTTLTLTLEQYDAVTLALEEIKSLVSVTQDHVIEDGDAQTLTLLSVLKQKAEEARALLTGRWLTKAAIRGAR